MGFLSRRAFVMIILKANTANICRRYVSAHKGELSARLSHLLKHGSSTDALVYPGSFKPSAGALQSLWSPRPLSPSTHCPRSKDALSVCVTQLAHTLIAQPEERETERD